MSLLAVAPPVCRIAKLREEAAAHWSWARFSDVRSLGTQVVLDFENANPPTQTDVDALVAAHDPSPAPPPADQAQFTAAVGKLRNTFGTSRSVADVNLCLDALTVVCRRLFQELQ